MNPELITQLRDIRDLDPVSWWPPAPGWWLLLAAATLLLSLLILWLRNLRLHPPGSWHRDAWTRLRHLQRRAREMPSRQLAGELSVLLRRIAVARHGRDRVAALHGDAWLAWLSAKDPAGFDWKNRGRILLTLAYAPPGHQDDGNREQLLALLEATLKWTRKPRTRK